MSKNTKGEGKEIRTVRDRGSESNTRYTTEQEVNIPVHASLLVRGSAFRHVQLQVRALLSFLLSRFGFVVERSCSCGDCLKF